MSNISLGTVPTGSVVVRKATFEDLRDDPSRIALIETPDGRIIWLPEQKSGLTSSSAPHK